MSYAILGGTGNIGTALIEQLKDGDVKLNVYARSQEKLLKAQPFLAHGGHKIFAGDMKSTELIMRCIEGTDAVFSAVGTNANNPNNHLAENSARVIVDALSMLRESAGKTFRAPTIIFVTSAGMAMDPKVRANFSSFLHFMLNRVGKYVYLDFQRAMAVFHKPENAWIPVVYICAPGLMPAASQGPVSVTIDISKTAPIWVSYTNLARAMLQVPEQRKALMGKEVAIVGTKEPPIIYSIMMFNFFTGLLCTYAQPVWRIGYKRGWWGW